jgi:hypothetical protein
MGTKNRKAGVAIATIGAVVLVSACSSSGNGTPTTTSSSSSGPSSTGSSAVSPVDRASLSGATLIAQTLAAIRSAAGFRVTASAVASGQSEKLDLHFGDNTASGTITTSGQTIQIISIAPYVFMKASQDFWKSQIPASQQAKVIPLLAGKWVKAYASNANFKDLAGILDRTSFVDQLTSGHPNSKFVNLGKSKMGSTATVELRDTTDGSLVYVAATGAPYPLQATPGKGNGPGLATFSEWNQPYSATEPPQSEVYDLTSLGQ